MQMAINMSAAAVDDVHICDPVLAHHSPLFSVKDLQEYPHEATQALRLRNPDEDD
jgi:hypothetical protein